jgi:predicted dehydrogenase
MPYVHVVDQVDKLIEEVDVAVLATHTQFLPSLIKRCAEANKPFLVEKPVARTLDEFLDI